MEKFNSNSQLENSENPWEVSSDELIDNTEVRDDSVIEREQRREFTKQAIIEYYKNNYDLYEAKGESWAHLDYEYREEEKLYTRHFLYGNRIFDGLDNNTDNGKLEFKKFDEYIRCDFNKDIVFLKDQQEYDLDYLGLEFKKDDNGQVSVTFSSDKFIENARDPKIKNINSVGEFEFKAVDDYDSTVFCEGKCFKKPEYGYNIEGITPIDINYDNIEDIARSIDNIDAISSGGVSIEDILFNPECSLEYPGNKIAVGVANGNLVKGYCDDLVKRMEAGEFKEHSYIEENIKDLNVARRTYDGKISQEEKQFFADELGEFSDEDFAKVLSKFSIRQLELFTPDQKTKSDIIHRLYNIEDSNLDIALSKTRYTDINLYVPEIPIAQDRGNGIFGDRLPKILNFSDILDIKTKKFIRMKGPEYNKDLIEQYKFYYSSRFNVSDKGYFYNNDGERKMRILIFNQKEKFTNSVYENFTEGFYEFRKYLLDNLGNSALDILKNGTLASQEQLKLMSNRGWQLRDLSSDGSIFFGKSDVDTRKLEDISGITQLFPLTDAIGGVYFDANKLDKYIDDNGNKIGTIKLTNENIRDAILKNAPFIKRTMSLDEIHIN